MNKALLAKLGWRLLNDNTSLWAQVLRSKYKVRDTHELEWLDVKGTWSSTWRSIGVGLREVVIPGISWVVGDGCKTRFWLDKWLLKEPLLDITTAVVPEGELGMCVNEFWDNTIGWLWGRIGPYLPENVLLQLRALAVDKTTGACDRLSWGETQDGVFTVRSAYALLTYDRQPRPNLSHLFHRVWSVVVPERVRLFLWLGMNQVIMTNVERQRRHLCDSGICQICKAEEETIMHILRDCPAMEGIWRLLVPPRKRNAFFAKSLIEWLYLNLGDHDSAWDTSWSTIFALGVWWSWKWRCGNVFGVNGKCRDRVRFIKELARETTRANGRIEQVSGSRLTRVERHIAWKRPLEGWFKLNTDGASRGNPGLAASGGVLRNENGEWWGGFALNIGICSAPLAELWGVYYGLAIAWQKGVSRLEVEVDSQIVVGFIQTGIGVTHPLSFLVRMCHGFLSRDWIVRVRHVYREANRLADGLANYAYSLPLGFHSFESIPTNIDCILREDIDGVSISRQIRS